MRDKLVYGVLPALVVFGLFVFLQHKMATYEATRPRHTSTQEE